MPLKISETKDDALFGETRLRSEGRTPGNRTGVFRGVLACTLLLGAGAAKVAKCQDLPSGPRVEVASVKVADNRTPMRMQSTGDRIVITGATVRDLVRIAYRFQDFQISGGPSWEERTFTT